MTTGTTATTSNTITKKYGQKKKRLEVGMNRQNQKKRQTIKDGDPSGEHEKEDGQEDGERYDELTET